MKNDSLKIMALLLCLIALSFFLPGKITGNASSSVIASIFDKIDVEVTLFDFSSVLTLGDLQNISAEITNTGSEEYDARMTEEIYNITGNSTLNLLATYTDSSVHLFPGNMRDYKTLFVPPYTGTYFIKLIVNYGPRLTNVWGSFVVALPGQTTGGGGGNQTQGNQTQGNQTQGGGSGGGGTGGSSGGGGGGSSGGTGSGAGAGGSSGGTGAGAGGAGQGTGTGAGLPPTASNFPISTDLDLNYSSNLTVYKNITTLLPITVRNIGNFRIDRMTLHTSLPSSFDMDVDPKAEQSLDRNESLLYLVTLNSRDSPVGSYELDFQVTSYYTKKSGTITVNVQEVPQSFKDLILSKILNYEFLLSQIGTEIETAGIKGYDVSLPRSYLNSAANDLNLTKRYFNFGEYDNSLKELDTTENDIKQAVFTLGNVTLTLYTYPGISYSYIILFFAIIAVILLLFYRNKKKNKRPRLLEKSKEEE